MGGIPSRFSQPFAGLALARPAEREQIPRVSAILRLIPANVHGAHLKLSELI